jgi:hypothetical protein
LSYDLHEMPVEKPIEPHQYSPPKRGLILRILYRVYTNYLGVTPPTPGQERVAAVVLIGGVVVGLIAIVVTVFLLWQWMMKMGGQ